MHAIAISSDFYYQIIPQARKWRFILVRSVWLETCLLPGYQNTGSIDVDAFHSISSGFEEDPIFVFDVFHLFCCQFTFKSGSRLNEEF